MHYLEKAVQVLSDVILLCKRPKLGCELRELRGGRRGLRLCENLNCRCVARLWLARGLCRSRAALMLKSFYCF